MRVLSPKVGRSSTGMVLLLWKGAPQGPSQRFEFQRSTLVDRLILALRSAGVELARTADLLRRVLDHLLPLRDPADRAGQREKHREHGGRETHRLQCDAGIKIDVWIEFLLDEVLV